MIADDNKDKDTVCSLPCGLNIVSPKSSNFKWKSSRGNYISMTMTWMTGLGLAMSVPMPVIYVLYIYNALYEWIATPLDCHLIPLCLP